VIGLAARDGRLVWLHERVVQRLAIACMRPHQ
jgi:hypothetical protein